MRLAIETLVVCLAILGVSAVLGIGLGWLTAWNRRRVFRRDKSVWERQVNKIVKP